MISYYFWNAKDFIAIKQIPWYVIVGGLFYIASQMLTRKFSNINNWWDWVFYFGLVYIMITVSFGSISHAGRWFLVVKSGTMALVVPAMIDFVKLLIHIRHTKK
jgi:hypothetical protein